MKAGETGVTVDVFPPFGFAAAECNFSGRTNTLTYAAFGALQIGDEGFFHISVAGFLGYKSQERKNDIFQ
jgi:hypothetical protein